MSTQTLNTLQSIAVELIRRDGTLHGYDISKYIKEHFPEVTQAHQGLYRALGNCKLQADFEPVYGKPDRKYYRLLPNVVYVHQALVLPIGVIEHFGLEEVASEKLNLLLGEKERLVRRKLAQGHYYSQLNHDANYLTEWLAKQAEGRKDKTANRVA